MTLSRLNPSGDPQLSGWSMDLRNCNLCLLCSVTGWSGIDCKECKAYSKVRAKLIVWRPVKQSGSKPSRSWLRQASSGYASLLAAGESAQPVRILAILQPGHRHTRTTLARQTGQTVGRAHRCRKEAAAAWRMSSYRSIGDEVIIQKTQKERPLRADIIAVGPARSKSGNDVPFFLRKSSLLAAAGISQ